MSENMTEQPTHTIEAEAIGNVASRIVEKARPAQQEMTVVTEAPPAVPVVHDEGVTLLQIVERAAQNPNTDIDKMQRLLEMYRDMKASQAKVEYAAAFAKMQPELPEIPKLGKGHNDITYAKWEDINDRVKPVIAKHGFALSFRTKNVERGIAVTAVLIHDAGHSEETTLELQADTSGSKNGVQALGSSTSYGKRYTAAAILNLTARDEDDNAVGTGELISDKQLEQLSVRADQVNADLRAFCKYLKVEALNQLPASKFDPAMRALNAKASDSAKARANA